MDRRASLKALAIGSISTGVLLEGCKLADREETKKAVETAKTTGFTIDRAKEEAVRDKALMESNFFTEHEMATIAVLADIIIPKDDVSGSATESGVPGFIDFIVQDMPQHQVPMRGGLRWLDLEASRRFEKSFVTSTHEQQIAIVDDIAFPEKAKPEMKPGVAFFNLMRNLTATGFYTSQIGIADLGYKGNTPNKWNGVPDDELKRLGIAYSEKELQECAKYS